jgi:hypothetical protein
MKSYNTLYYLLVVLLIMGAFASMAQNRYGLQILSVVSIAFALTFLIQLISALGGKNRKKEESPIEFLSLFILAVLFALRSFQIYSHINDWIFAVAAFVLALVYLQRMILHYAAFIHKNRNLAVLLLAGYLSIVLFCVATLTASFSLGLAKIAGGISLIVVLILAAFFLSRPGYIVEGESTTLFKTIAGFKDRFFLLLSLFIIFSLYTALTSTGTIPKLYFDDYPQAYYQLVNDAETGREKAVDGTFKYQRFKTEYDGFLNSVRKSESK